MMSADSSGEWASDRLLALDHRLHLGLRGVEHVVAMLDGGQQDAVILAGSGLLGQEVREELRDVAVAGRREVAVRVQERLLHLPAILERRAVGATGGAQRDGLA